MRSARAMRRYRDRDYLQTSEGYFFCVVGPTHPKDRVIAYLKYVPEASGTWGRERRRFRRALRYYTIARALATAPAGNADINCCREGVIAALQIYV